MASSMENVFANVIQNWLSKDTGVINLSDMLTVCTTNQLFSLQKPSGIQETLSYVHNCLSSSKRRIEGLLILHQIVQQSTTEVFQQNALTWIRLLLQVLKSHCQPPVYRASCQILGQILSFSKNFSDVSREIVNSVMPQLVPLLLSSPKELRVSAVLCINSCIVTYPGPLGPFKNKIEALITKELDSGTAAEEVYRCYALIAQCGPGGTMGVKYAESWIQQCNKLMASLENTLTDLYEGLETDSSSLTKGGQCIALETIEADEPNRVTALSNRWKTLTGCLESLLSEEISAVAKLPADRIIQLVCRCLAINCKMLLSRPTQERMLLAGLLPDIHIAALGALHKLILLCRTLLIPHCMVISSLFCQELLWTYTENCGHNVQYGCLREVVYEVMVTWLKVQDGSSGIVNEEKSIVKQILLDCAPYEDTLKLNTTTSSTKTDESGPSKKKKRKGYQEIGQGISSQRKVLHYANSRLVSTALEALYWILTTSGSELEGTSVQDIQGFVIRTLLSIQQTKDLPIPYSCTTCRRGLYRVLQACMLTPHPTAPPPTQCALAICTVGLLDQNIEISSFCVETMRILEPIIHPRVPCLNGPIICESVVKVGAASDPVTAEVFNCGHIGEIEKVNGSDSVVQVGRASDHVTASWSGLNSSNNRPSRKRPANVDMNTDGSDDDVVITKVVSKNERDSDSDSELDSMETDDDEEDPDCGIVDVDAVSSGRQAVKYKEDSQNLSGDTNNGSGDKVKQVEPTAGTSFMETSDGIPARMLSGTAVEGTAPAEGEGDAVVEVSSGEESSSGPVVVQEMEKDTEKKEDTVEVESILMTFVDAGPDSD